MSWWKYPAQDPAAAPGLKNLASDAEREKREAREDLLGTLRCHKRQRIVAEVRDLSQVVGMINREH